MAAIKKVRTEVYIDTQEYSDKVGRILLNHGDTDAIVILLVNNTVNLYKTPTSSLVNITLERIDSKEY